MIFGHPENMIWFLAVLFIGILLVFGQKRSERRMSLIMNFKMKEALLKGVSPSRRFWMHFIWLAGVILVLFALLSPRWGFRWEEIKRKGIDMYIAIDTSKSMLCEDVPPSRLARAKLEVKDLLLQLHGDRIGLITFAGKAFLRCPLTYDTSALQLFLDDIRVEDMPVGGTSFASAIKIAVKHLKSSEQKEKILIILSDGEDHDEETESALQEAVKQGITIHSIGIGTEEGGPLSVSNGKEKRYVKDKQGNIVISQLNMSSLKQISGLTRGIAAVSSKGTDLRLADVYARKLEELEKKEFAQKKRKKYFERYAYFIAAALALFTLVIVWGGVKKK